MTKHAWFDNNYEGKALRRVFTKLMRRFEKSIDDDSIDLETLSKISHTLTIVAKCKADLAKPENEYILRLAVIEQALGIGKKIEYRGELSVRKE